MAEQSAFDVVIGSLMAVVAAPILVFAAIAIKLEDGGSVLYRQRRLGESFHIVTATHGAARVDGEGWSADLPELETVIVPAAYRGILTAILLAFARVAGETAPLLFTAFGNRFWSPGWNQPTASLPASILRTVDGTLFVDRNSCPSDLLFASV